MVLDTVLTLAIGRNGSDGAPLSNKKWTTFRHKALTIMESHGLVVANTLGRAIGSDGVNEGKGEHTAIIVAINPKNVEEARKSIAALLPRYNQGSAAFSYDGAHEPVFATATGWRSNED